MPEKINLGPINEVILLGGGLLLFELSLWLKSQGIKVIIVTAERHAREEIRGFSKTLQQLAEDSSIKLFVANDINNLEMTGKFIRITDKSFALSFGAAWIFKARTIEELFHKKLFNLHGSRLPQYRGGGGFSWQILRGSRLGFCLIHFIEPGIDTGNILDYEEFLYPVGCRIPVEYEKWYHEKNMNYLQRLFKKLQRESVTFETTSQQEYFSHYWPRLHTPTHSWIDWSMPLEMLDRFICAFDDPYVGAQTTRLGSVVRLKKSMPDYNDGTFHHFQYGLVYRNNGKWLSIASNGGTLIVESAADEHGQNLISSIRLGDRFFTPYSKIEQAYNQRIFYDSKGLQMRGEDALIAKPKNPQKQ